MRKLLVVVGLVVLVVVGASNPDVRRWIDEHRGSGTGPGKGSGAVTASQLDVTAHSSCHHATGEPTTCTITLSSASDSTGDFDWAGLGDRAAGTVYSPSSGTVKSGSTSSSITTTTPDGLCPFTLEFVDKNNNYGITVDVTECTG